MHLHRKLIGRGIRRAKLVALVLLSALMIGVRLFVDVPATHAAMHPGYYAIDPNPAAVTVDQWFQFKAQLALTVDPTGPATIEWGDGTKDRLTVILRCPTDRGG